MKNKKKVNSEYKWWEYFLATFMLSCILGVAVCFITWDINWYIIRFCLAFSILGGIIFNMMNGGEKK